MGAKEISVISCLLAAICVQVNGNGLEGRIVNGRPARVGEAPYQLLIVKDGSPSCGATLVTSPEGEQFAVTAAHCVTDPGNNPQRSYPVNEFFLRGGDINRRRGQDVRIKKIIVHPKWRGSFAGDLALLIFNGEFDLSDNLKPAELANAGVSLPEGKKVTVSGWGVTRQDGATQPEILQIVELPVVGTATCNGVYRSIFSDDPDAVIDDSHMCLGYAKGGKDACQGTYTISEINKTCIFKVTHS